VWPRIRACPLLALINLIVNPWASWWQAISWLTDDLACQEELSPVECEREIAAPIQVHRLCSTIFFSCRHWFSLVIFFSPPNAHYSGNIFSGSVDAYLPDIFMNGFTHSVDLEVHLLRIQIYSRRLPCYL
jgi:hypothetical protein